MVADTVRALSADAVQQANSGHPGLPLGCAEIGALLFAEVLRHDPEWPQWPDRDRFVLSAGHGSMLLYSLLHLCGYALPLDELRRFRQRGSATPGHPEHGVTPGVETTTGPLGQGFANAVGMALAERMLAARYNRPGLEVVDHRTWVLASDGDMMEGVASEAASLAGHLGLGRLVVIYDCNRISIEGSTDLAFSEDVARRFEAYGWRVRQVDGHDLAALRDAFAWARREDDRPALIVAHTRLAAKSPLEGQAEAHGAPLGADAVRALKRAIGFPEDEPFFVPEAVRAFFETRRPLWKAQSRRWQERFADWSRSFPELRRLWDEAFAGEIGELGEALAGAPGSGAASPSRAVSTRVAGGEVLRAIARQVPHLVGGSADLAPSTHTYLDGMGSVARGRYDARNLHFGVREHAMGGILNGIALHGGLRPFGSTFLVFSDYMRPSIRLAAMMGLPVIYIFTHDSVYVGEDGPTHQPVEQLEALRAIPGLEVWRPADGAETALAWLEVLRRRSGPSALVLTRQAVKPLALEGPEPAARQRAGMAWGAYVVHGVHGPWDMVFLASGSEVSLALEAASRLAQEGVRVRVISVPCRERLMAAPQDLRRELLGPGTVPRVAVEAGVGTGWAALGVEPEGLVGVSRFGVSAPAAEAARAVGLTLERVVEVARRLLAKAGPGARSEDAPPGPPGAG